ncbi:hypothetical protein F441_14882 [Phytophthora nicotianae CJ01A1]|uniref:Uncharacterized protein n=3 Tax=Phytophthora nicotianae TaxID=4792 RepID=W2IFJ6_PHYNI|nr:hypothetical protein L915_14627 [Phytophthora nicotianae]ETL32946.1 hypothetical protein L916_14535 [Phytophthora nicotianae]ETO68067.1 hypothetical protein F444_15061 [Phytophthora nicotianae P1976]ETP09248.1 hypothetical protein F441_14882 [Phytophthora nicotianae CJ01A1]
MDERLKRIEDDKMFRDVHANIENNFSSSAASI